MGDMQAVLAVLEEKMSTKKMVMFGAGWHGQRFLKHCHPQCMPAYICDNDPAKAGTRLLGMDVVSPDTLEQEDRSGTVVLITPFGAVGAELYEEVAALGFETCSLFQLEHPLVRERVAYFEKNMDRLPQTEALFEDARSRHIFHEVTHRMIAGKLDYSDLYDPALPSYLIPELFGAPDDAPQVVVDAGACMGDTVEQFSDFFGRRLVKLFAFEPGRSQLEKLREVIDRKALQDVVTVFPVGLSDKEEQLVYCYVKNLPGASFVRAFYPQADDWEEVSASYTIALKRMDDCVSPAENVTFLKMDIEGGEMKALLGAKNLITQTKPKLAISIYHNGADFIEIPNLVKTWVPEYKLYCRQHMAGPAETVMYATL